ncbi:hypothetical protein BC826DRAFT_422723 [Russula brevipes]|nr:hypothetical protein BC826DRAFT_422723 [Russula brevipes]
MNAAGLYIGRRTGEAALGEWQTSRSRSHGGGRLPREKNSRVRRELGWWPEHLYFPDASLNWEICTPVNAFLKRILGPGEMGLAAHETYPHLELFICADILYTLSTAVAVFSPTYQAPGWPVDQRSQLFLLTGSGLPTLRHLPNTRTTTRFGRR